VNREQTYAVVVYDGSNGACFRGIASGAVLADKYPNAFSRNDDGLFQLDEEGMMFAVPTDGPAFEPD
jgi:hypothetical protein